MKTSCRQSGVQKTMSLEEVTGAPGELKVVVHCGYKLREVNQEKEGEE